MAKTWGELKDAYGGAKSYLEDCYLGASSPVPTNIPDLDDVLHGGMRPGLHVLGGEPGSGKSALGLFLSMMSAKAGARVFYASLEMGAGQCWDRCASCMSLGTGRSFEWGDAWKLGCRARDRLGNVGGAGDARDLLADDPVGAAVAKLERECPGLLIADSPRIHSIDGLEAAACEAAEAGLSMLVVDYLQYVGVDGAANEYERVSEVSRRLDLMGVALGVPVLALASLSRAGAAPSMHAYKGSGDIEYNALSAWVIQRDPDHDGIRELHVVKNRFGSVTGDRPVRLRFDGAHCCFEVAGWRGAARRA